MIIIDSIDKLQESTALKVAPKSYCNQWRKQLKQGGKKGRCYQWTIAGLLRLPESLVLNGFQRCLFHTCSASCLRKQNDPSLPTLDLQSTAKWFIKRLGVDEQAGLAAFARAWDGKVIRIGTTCSGTDVCVVVVSKTIAYICDRFGVAGLNILSVRFRTMHIYVSYIYIWFNTHLYIYTIYNEYIYISIFSYIHTYIYIYIYTYIYKYRYSYLCIYIYTHICFTFTYAYIYTYTMFIYIYVFVFIYIYMYTLTPTYTYRHIYIHICLFTYIYVYLYTHTHIYTYMCISIFTYIYIHIYIYTCTYFQINNQPDEVNIGVKHMFAVEKNPKKQSFILSAHGKSGPIHLWGDVNVFEQGHGYCLVCECECSTKSQWTYFFSGPSCKKVSRMNSERTLCWQTITACLYIYI